MPHHSRNGSRDTMAGQSPHRSHSQMPRKHTTRSLDEFREALEKALVAGGKKYQFNSHAEAVKFRHRCNHYRKIDREAMTDIGLDPSDPRWGTSPYDGLELSLPKRGTPGDNILTIRVYQKIAYVELDMDGNPVKKELFDIKSQMWGDPPESPPGPNPDPLQAIGATRPDDLDLGPEVPEPGPGQGPEDQP